MNEYGFIRVATAIPEVKVADCGKNVDSMIHMAEEAEEKHVDILCFPELAVTAYTCGDLLLSSFLLDKAEEELGRLVERTKDLKLTLIAGCPVRCGNSVYNCAVVISKGKIHGVVPKLHLPSYNEFYETRWFASGIDAEETSVSLCGENGIRFSNDTLFSVNGVKFSIEICEDLWTPCPPSSQYSINGSELIFNLSASNELAGKHDYRISLIKQQSARTITGYIYCSAGFGESSTDLLFSGFGIVCENGSVIAESERFQITPQLTVADIDVERLRSDRRKNTYFMRAKHKCSGQTDFTHINVTEREKHNTSDGLIRKIEKLPFVSSEEDMDKRCDEIFNIQSHALAVRLKATGIKKMVIGVSGGLDSTLALLVCSHTADLLGIDRSEILGVTMPGFGTTDRTYSNAVYLIKSLGCEFREISIKTSCLQHFEDIGHDPEITDATYENAQARERTQILMDLSNKVGGLVIGTGDLSELALGWATYNGDQMSMYGVNASIPKTLIKTLVKWIAENKMDGKVKETLMDIIDTPVSPELLPADENGKIKQKTEDLVGPYELHDFFLYYTLRFGFSPKKILFLAETAFNNVYDKTTIKKWLKVFYRRFFSQQFKRSAMPDGPKVGSVCLSPRGDWRMPSDASSRMWTEEIDNL